MSHEHYVQMARMAEQADRFDDMAECMKKAVEILDQSKPVSAEERNLLSVAYKNAVGSRRAAWRVTSNIEMRSKLKSDDEGKTEVAKTYREEIERELDVLCKDILDLLHTHLITNAQTHGGVESLVFYRKMLGDYYRYCAEIESENNRQATTAKLAQQAYEEAKSESLKLSTTHPIRLGLQLNYSVFLYEIMNDPNRACKVAKTAFDDAIAEFDSVGDDFYKDANLIMQLLRDNLTLWTSDVEKDDEFQ